MPTELLMGNATAGLGALRAGVNVVCGYPGTPSTEVLETIAAHVKAWYNAGLISAADAPHIEWSINEKAALEVAAGASMSGARALVTMKQVGLNVASDPLMSLAYLGTKGGLVLYVADDPGPISSQTEQDTRQFAQFAKIPIFDAAMPEELYSMMRQAFELSEQFATPVIVRASTRICHGSAAVELGENYLSPTTANSLAESPYTPHPISGFERSPHWVSFPALVNTAHQEIVQRLPIIADLFSNFGLNQIITPDNGSEPPSIGIAAGGASWGYLLDGLESLADEQLQRLKLLRIATPFPFVDSLAEQFFSGLKKVIVFEELEAVIERELLRVAGAKQLAVQIHGKLTGSTTVAGENSVTLIAEQLKAFLNCPDAIVVTVADDAAEPSLDVSTDVSTDAPSCAPPAILARPPVLCAGCPHRASFSAVKRALRGKKATFSGDIGCYTLGNALPLEMVDSCVCMGAGFTISQGMYWAEPDAYRLGFVGDSTFFASGMTGVANAVYNRAAVTFFVLDNSITAMTGSQPHPGTGLRMSYDSAAGDVANSISIPAVLRALGVKHVVEQNPLEFERAVDVVREAVGYDGVSAVVFQAPCINVSKPQAQPDVDTNKCVACRQCINILGCPALLMANDTREAAEATEAPATTEATKVTGQGHSYIQIESSLCYGCDLCVQICPFHALVSNHKAGTNAI